MPRHTIEITDEANNSFDIVVSIGISLASSGSWRSLDKGYIRYHNGRALFVDSYLESAHLVLCDSPQSHKYGLRLNDYVGWLSVNDDGMGYVWQPWVIALKPGRIQWALIE